jgi:antitoxin ParD1/3/4
LITPLFAPILGHKTTFENPFLAVPVHPGHTISMEDAMTVKRSISLRDDPHAFAKALVDGGRFLSVSAVVQQGLDLLRPQDADARADRAALCGLLAERAAGPFLSAGDLRARLETRRSARAE